MGAEGNLLSPNLLNLIVNPKKETILIKFALIGDGAIAKYHKEAIKHVGGELLYIVDPKYKQKTHSDFGGEILPNLRFPNYVDYAVIASPSYLHYQQIKEILKSGHILRGIICEKPAFLPWESPIDDDRINIVLQLRYLPNLPEKADLISVRFVRDKAYFKSWKGDARKTGGLFYNLFLHGIDLAMQLGADFEGLVSKYGHQERWIMFNPETPRGFRFYSDPTDIGADNYSCGKQWGDDSDTVDILNINTQAYYNHLYEAILEGKGIKPSDIFYLNWILQRNSEIFGYGRNGIGKIITIKNELI